MEHLRGGKRLYTQCEIESPAPRRCIRTPYSPSQISRGNRSDPRILFQVSRNDAWNKLESKSKNFHFSSSHKEGHLSKATKNNSFTFFERKLSIRSLRLHVKTFAVIICAGQVCRKYFLLCDTNHLFADRYIYFNSSISSVESTGGDVFLLFSLKSDYFISIER